MRQKIENLSHKYSKDISTLLNDFESLSGNVNLLEEVYQDEAKKSYFKWLPIEDEILRTKAETDPYY